MFNPDIELRVARERHEAMLKYFERQQLYEQLPQSRSNRLKQLGHRFGNAVKHLKTQVRPRPPVAVLGKR